MAKKKAKISTVSNIFANYSKSIQKSFGTLSIQPGDRISVLDGDKYLEGNLLEQNELGDPDIILLKLENGYNLGIRHTPTSIIKKLEGQVDLESFQIRVPKQNPDLPEISLLATGGTIASRIDYQTGGVVMAMQPEEIFASLPELFDEVSFKSVQSLFNLGSEDMNHNEWSIIAKQTAKELNSGSRGVVISHGTDTMAYTAAALSFMLPKLSAPVVLTGAQRSSDRGSFDGAINLISATRVAAKSDIASVMICMHQTSNDDMCQLSRGTKVRKMHTSRRDAFRTINDEPLAVIDIDGKITEINSDIPRRFEGTVQAKTKFEEKVALIKIYPNISPDILDWYVDQGYKGIIIEGTGLGHVPSFPTEKKRSWLPHVQRAVEEDVFVGITSQCLYGRVHPFVYKALRSVYQVGGVYLEDMLSETALIKLGWVLANHKLTEIKEIMLTNLAGEISDLSRYQEFRN